MREVQQLSHHLRHRIIKSQQRDRIDDLLHGAPLCPLLRPDLGKPVRPGAQGGRHIIDVHGKVHYACRLGGGMLRNLAV